MGRIMLLKESKKSVISLLIAASVAVSGFIVSPAIAGEGNSQEINNDSRNWGTPASVITNTNDQRNYDLGENSKFKNIQVFGTEVMPIRNVATAASLTPLGSGNLVDHKGSVLNAVNIYSIFWGPSFATTNYQTDVNNFLKSLACSGSSCTGVSATVNQYFHGASETITVSGKTYVDASTPPSSAPSTGTIVSEAAKVVSAAKDTLDPNGLYFVFTSNFPSRANYCAWHGAGSAKIGTSTTSFAVAYMPYLGNMLSGCGANYLPAYSKNTNPAVDSVVNVTTHELFEAMTDSLISGNAWYDAKGYENGDKCAWNWSTTLSGYTVQQEYSNSKSNCAGS